MTEAEWMACRDSLEMLKHLGDKASERKLRLFACACCRRIWSSLIDPRSRQAVDVAERYADGLVKEQDREATAAAAYEATSSLENAYATDAAYATILQEVNAAEAAEAAYSQVASTDLTEANSWTEMQGRGRFNWPVFLSPVEEPLWKKECALQAILLCDIFGNPFHTASIETSWLAWNDGAIPKIAQTIYDDRAFDRLPLLADAFEDAGCTDADILGHCRTPGEHVRGCWVVDLLLGKS